MRLLSNEPRDIEKAIREPRDSPEVLQHLATVDLPSAADYMGGLVYDLTVNKPKFSNGTAWSVWATGTAASKDIGTSGDKVPVLNGAATTWGAGATFAGALNATNVSATGFSAFPAANAVSIYISSSEGHLLAYNGSSAMIPMNIKGSIIRFNPNDVNKLSIDPTFGNYANDAAAASGGVPVGSMYRNGSVLMVRVS